MNQLSRWYVLFDAAMSLIERAEQTIGGRFLWSFGGGTALMLQIDHRESHDVDLFVDDVQVLPYLNPLTQEYTLTLPPDDYEADGTRMIKLIYHDVGEIDFISCADITNLPNSTTVIRNVLVKLETPAEIVAKKIFYRGGTLQPRDMFDVAAVVHAKGDAYVLDAMQQCGSEKCAMALSATERFDADAARSVIERLMHRDQMKALIPTARGMTIDLLRRALG